MTDNTVQPGSTHRGKTTITKVHADPEPQPIAEIDKAPVVITRPVQEPAKRAEPKIIGRVMVGGRLVPVYERR
jgi:hypothetical protein